MLVISRRENEIVLIGEVRVMVTRIDGGLVRLGIEAPADVPIVRAELLAEETGETNQGDREWR
ncbi:MAG TPA: carbon storage regulator [Pirellulales bacterium]|nr:carbon storage regulator [Pirellulales bacterium]